MNEILRSGLRLYSKYFGVLLGLVVTIGLPCQWLSNYLAYRVFAREEVLRSLLASACIELIFGILITGGILHVLFVDRLGRRAGLTECLSVSFHHWFQLFWTNFLILAIISPLMALLFFLPIHPWAVRLIFLIPAIFLVARLSLAITIVMVEGEWGASALHRSLRVTLDHSWRNLALGLVVYFPIQAVSFIGVRMLQTNPAFDNWPFSTAIGTALKFVACLIPICFFRLYETLIETDSGED